MMREPKVTTQTRQVRVITKTLTKDDFMPSLFGCVNSWRQKTMGSRKVHLLTLTIMAL